MSTIIPVHNRARLLVEAVESVMAQTYRPIEILIIDDGSTDQTAEIADGLARQEPDLIKVVHQANGGPGLARQRGLELAMGAYIQFLDSDDLLLPEKFRLQVRELKRQPDCGICYGRSVEENHACAPPLRHGSMRETGAPHLHLFPRLLVERWWTTSSPLYRSSLLDRIGPWQPWINEEDWEYDARAGATGVKLGWVDADVSVRRIHLCDDHLSSQGWQDPRKLRERSLAKLSIYRSALEAGLTHGSSEMEEFSRTAFHLSRQCGVAGVPDASRRLFQLARQATIPTRRNNAEFRFYRLMAALLGWGNAARVSITLRRLFPSHG